ncbi:hypothetical protein M422DRAFT_273049 [Sphaerobolus stellatus SS14]|uniref:Uncharacterized protein n=1 Tax=Sphaerobolus stellatus (strain SS14) TaxID=990650 RepID=A0A0C9UKL1_SPHS4|nr:hypothetical protein M422DRAFT_273049 [Sphaerobolus stellatus SS14]
MLEALSAAVDRVQNLYLIIGSLVLLYALKTFIGFQRALKAVNYHPRWRYALEITTIASSLLPHISYFSTSSSWPLAWKYKAFLEKGWDTMSLVDIYWDLYLRREANAAHQIGFFPKASAGYVTVDPVTEISTYHEKFVKPTTEGPEWKRHRRATAPTFSERNNRLVWDETIGVVDDMFDAWGHDTPEIFTDDLVQNNKAGLALLVISAAGMCFQKSTQPTQHRGCQLKNLGIENSC